jgi:alginate O-acetyltransferase complex protein AlgJ
VSNGRASKLPPVHEAWLPNQHSLYRPRHAGTQRGALVCAVIFFLVPALALVLGGPSQTNENRKPNEFPSLADGWNFFTGMSPWANDHLAFKQGAVDFSGWLGQSLFGDTPQYGTAPEQQAPGPVGPVAPPVTQPGPQQPTAGGYPQVIEGKDGWLYLGDDTRVECLPNLTMDEVMKGLVKIRNAVQASGRKFVLTVPPDKSTMVPEHLPDSYAGKDCAAERKTSFWARANTEVGVVDLRGPLAAQASAMHQPVYFQQDSHWTFAGGLTMTQQIAERIAPGCTMTWRMAPTVPWNREEDLPPLIDRSAYQTTSRYSLAPDGGVDRTNWGLNDFRTPSVFNNPSVPGMVPGKVVMVADSFSHFASPFLAAAIGQLTITHVDNLGSDPTGVANLMTQGDTVVIEVAERGIASGYTHLLDPKAIDAITHAMAQHPIR